MKRLFFCKGLIGLFAGLFLLMSACGTTELGDYETREYETYVGEFKSLGGASVYENVTHLFETEDGDILYVYSDRYDLEDEAYSEKQVEAYGVVSTYAELDKPLFEVKRITDAPEKDEDSEEVSDVEYQDEDLGFSMVYPNDWTLSSAANSVTLSAPITPLTAVATADEETTTSTEDAQVTGETAADTIYIAQLDNTIAKTAEDSQEDRASELRTAVTTDYTDLAAVESELTYVGPDRLFSVRYKTENGDIYYFIPRGTELFELAYYHNSESDADRLTNANIFASLVSGFRFTTASETVEADTTDETDEAKLEVEVDVDDADEEESTAKDIDQVSFSGYRELESKTFQFKMSYPSNWYYSGTSAGYAFGDTPQDAENATTIIQMLFNQSQTEGINRTSTTVSVTVKVGDRTYTLTGPLEYETVIQTMADSIISVQSM